MGGRGWSKPDAQTVGHPTLTPKQGRPRLFPRFPATGTSMALPLGSILGLTRARFANHYCRK